MYFIEKKLKIKSMELENRLVLPPMASGKCTQEGLVTDALLDYYEEKAHGGYLSLIITEHSFVHRQGKASPNQLSMASDAAISGLGKLADTIHRCGASAIAQISHAGAAAKSSVTGMETVGPVRDETEKLKAERELSVNEIHEIVKWFADAALRVKKAGFDGVEIHSAHAYLLNQFYSPLSNHRLDQYGGSLENRIRIHLEIIAAVRESVGEDFPLFLRLGACDYTDGGNTVEDAIQACQHFEKAGVDVLDISGGMLGYMFPGCKERESYYDDVSEAVKKNVSIPVLVTGGISDISVVEHLLEKQKADLVGIGRAMFKDSNWAEHAMKTLK